MPRIVPVLHRGVLLGLSDTAAVRVDGVADRHARIGGRIGFLSAIPQQDCRIDVRQDGSDFGQDFQIGGWAGNIDWTQEGVIAGRAHNLRDPAADPLVVAFDSFGPVAWAVAGQNGVFQMFLPATLRSGPQRRLRLGIAGSDFVFAGEDLVVGQVPATVTLSPVAPPALTVRIKISTPNLKEAPAWGDYHFSRSLQTSFEKLGIIAATDTHDDWYDHPDEDVVIALRGRHRLKVDPNKINIMWLISHPDRIPVEEYRDYDHIAVASDIYAKGLRNMGLPSVSVLHQATDAALFGTPELLESERKPACLFVGNSRREYRTMVKWGIQQNIPLELYGGGWDGVLPAEAVRALNVPNAALPEFYAGHLIVLNDHWDSMRDNGFLSNRLFDASATGAPIITDEVRGLAEVFADTINVADTPERFAELVQDCLADPGPWMARAARARDIVLGAHTFDHRAQQLADLVGMIQRSKGGI